MNLFPYEPTRNLLPFDGIANYYGPILTSREAQDYLEALLTTIPWKNDEAVICGKTHRHRPQGRLVRRFELLLHLLRNDQGCASLDEGIASRQENGRRESGMLVQFMSLQSIP